MEILLCENKQWMKPLKVLLICLIVGAILSVAMLAFVALPIAFFEYLDYCDMNEEFEDAYLEYVFNEEFFKYKDLWFEDFQAKNPDLSYDEAYGEFYEIYYDTYFESSLKEFYAARSYDYYGYAWYHYPNCDGLYDEHVHEITDSYYYYEETCYDYDMVYYYQDEPWSMAWERDAEEVAAFSGIPFGAGLIIGLWLFIEFKFTRLYITNKRVYGTRFLGRRADIPLDKIVWVSRGLFFGRITIATPSFRALHFNWIRNYREMQRVICELLNSRQPECTAEPGCVRNPYEPSFPCNEITKVAREANAKARAEAKAAKKAAKAEASAPVAEESTTEQATND